MKTTMNRNNAMDKDARIISMIEHLRHIARPDDEHKRRLALLENRMTRISARPQNSTANKPIKAYKQLTSHKTPNVGNMIISADCYTLPKIIVGAKIKAARRRGVANAQNVYIQYYMEMLHTAFLAVYAARIQESVFDEMRADVWYQNNPDQLPPKMELGDYIRLGCRACGRFAYSIEKRGGRAGEIEIVNEDGTTETKILGGIGDQHIKNNTRVPKTSPMENRIESAVDTKDFYERAKKAIMYLKTSQRNKEYLLTALDGKAATLPRPVDTLRNLDRVLKAARLIDSDVTGRRFIV